jgi:hypothetical protein
MLFPLRVEHLWVFTRAQFLESVILSRAHFRAALRRQQYCLVFNGAECFQLFLGGEFLGCERLLDGGHRSLLAFQLTTSFIYIFGTCYYHFKTQSFGVSLRTRFLSWFA